MKLPLHVQLTTVALAHLVAVAVVVVVAAAQTNNTNGTNGTCGMMSMLENTTLDPSLLLFGGARTFLPNVNGSEATSVTAPNGIVSPVAGNTTTCANFTSSPTNNVSSTYGPRLKYSDGGRSDFHLGVDFYGSQGDPLYAIADGVVAAVYMEGSSAYPNGGNVVILEHQFPGGDVPLRRGSSSSSPNSTTTFMVGKYYSVYLHCLNYTVVAGQTVTSGMQVATMGQTGDTIFTHLHFELRVGSRCSYQYQLANPNSSCAVGYVPHVHPFTILPTTPNADDGGVQQSLCNGSMQASFASTPSTTPTRNGLTGWYLSTKTPGVNITFPNASSVDFTVVRPNYAVNRLEINFVRLLNNSQPPNATSCMDLNATNTDGGAVMKAVFDFSTFEGFDPSTLTILDNFTNFTPSVFPGVLVPGEVLSTSTHYNFQATMHAGWAIWQFQVYDVLGNGVSRNNTQWVQLPSPSQGANGTTAGESGNTTTTTTTTTTTSNTTTNTTLEGSNISGAKMVGLHCTTTTMAVLLPLLLLLAAAF